MRSNRDKDLESIINEMYTHKIEIPVNNTVEDTDETVAETGCNTKREDASDEDKIKCPHCDKLIQASSCASHNEDTDDEEPAEEATDNDEDVKDLQALHDNPDEEFAKKNYGSVQAYKDMLKKKIDKLLNASHCN